ncbi:MAG TPA: fibronectin type III domain-containing protein [Wenzhouxiangella sp.]
MTRNKGRLVVEEGGQLTTTNTSIQPHNNVSSIGGVTLQGIWTNLNSLSITAGESDALLIENGGQLTTPNLTIDTDGEVRLVDADSLLRVDQGSNQGQGVVVINGAGRLRVGVPQGLTPEPPGTVEAAKVQLVSNGTLTFEHNSSNYDFGPTIGGAGIVNFDEGSTRLSGGMSNLESESTTIWMRDGATWSLGSDQNIEAHAILNWEVGATLSVNVTDTQTFGKLTFSYSSNLGPAGEPNIKLADGNVNLTVNVADCAALNNGDVLEAVVKSIRGSVQTQPNTSVVVSDNCAELNFVAVIKEQQIDLNAIKPLSAIFEQGDGSTTDPYIITNWEQFVAIHQALDKHFVLAANLDKDSEGYATYGAATADAGAGFDPIGNLVLDGNNEVDETASSLFTGSLDGAGFTVSDLVINRSETSGVAVFAGLSATAKVTNFTLENISVTGKDFVAGLSAYTQGNITNVSVTGEVSGETVVGGLVAENLGNNTDQGVIDQANSNVVTTASAQTAGGLVAKNVTGEVKESSASGEVKATDTVGGLIGLNDGGAVDRSFSRTAVISDGTKVGGLVGEVSTASGTPTITESLWDQEASGQTSSAGGGSAKSSEDMTSFATYDALWNDETTTVIIEGWADPTDSSVTATWGICTGVNDGYPFRLLEYASDPCVISTLKITLSESGGLLRNIPFGVSITSESSFGDPIAVDEDVVITLSAEVSGSSTSGQLGFVDSDAPTTVTLSQGEHTVTVDNLFYSGLSDPEAVGDITLKAEAQLAEQTLSGQQAISVRDIAFVLTADETDPLPTGESFVITATLKDLNDQPVANQATTFTTTLGTLEGANSEGIVVATTDGTGKAQVTLTSDVAGDAVVTAKCPGSCPQSITVTFIALTAAAPVIESVEPGNGQLTVNFTPPTDLGGAVISNYEYQLNGGDWVAFDPAVITSPATITGLTNGQDYTVKLRAISQGGPGEVSNGKTNSPFTAPTAPQNVTVTAQPAAILVSWASPADDGGRDITGYRVLINGEVACEVEAGAGTYSCRIEDLSSDAAYDVEVLAVTDGATTPSTEEATFEVTPLPILPVPTLSLWALIALMLLLLVWAQHSLRPRLS